MSFETDTKTSNDARSMVDTVWKADLARIAQNNASYPFRTNSLMGLVLHQTISPVGVFAMLLQRGEVRSYDDNRMVVEFTMLNQDKIISCAISTAAMDDLEGRRDLKPAQRVDQFMRLREIIEERVSRKFFEEQAQADRPVVLRSNDF